MMRPTIAGQVPSIDELIMAFDDICMMILMVYA